MNQALGALLARHRAVVCVGTGGVGKTTIAAAIALASAMQGRRTMVLTIDPARQLARALGLEALGRIGEPIATEGLAPAGMLHAAMLDQKGAWDAFIDRHAPNAEVRERLLGNPFYEKLSTSMAGSTEYMAIEELCRLDESGAYDLIVVDTPPSAHAVDFLKAPDRIARLLDPEVAGWIARGTRRGVEAVSGAVRLFLRWIERSLGTQSLSEVTAFIQALETLLGDMAARAERARTLLFGSQTAFVLVGGARQGTARDAEELAESLRVLGAPLRAAVVNRAHIVDAVPAATMEAAIEETGASLELQAWLRETWATARALDRGEQAVVARLARTMPAGSTIVTVPELEHDAHSLEDLAELAAFLGAPERREPDGTGAGAEQG